MLFHGLGEEAQRALGEARVLLCGCGALGTVLAETLTRAGVGFIRVVDRDFVEMSNLQRQTLFDENDVRDHLPKAVAAARRLRAINSDITIEERVLDIGSDNILNLCNDVDLILDGTDNFEVRFLINDAALETSTPWIYTGCIGSHGQTMPIFPHHTACLRCLMPDVPEPGSTETCDTAGVLGPAINIIASFEAITALKILSGQQSLVTPTLLAVDVWDSSLRPLDMSTLRENSGCPACHEGERRWLNGEAGSQSTVLCGRNAVQISPATRQSLQLSDLQDKLKASGDVMCNRYLLRLTLTNPDYELTVFPDGRMIVKGTEDPAVARSLYARYIGS